jgi:PAS domain S-box-containing protein
MSIYSILLMAGVVLAVAIGTIVLNRNSRNPANLVYASLCFLAALSTFVNSLISQAGSEREVFTLLHLVSLRLLIFPMSVHFYLAFTRQKKILRGYWLYLLLYLFPAILILTTNPHGLFDLRYAGEGLGWFFYLKQVPLAKVMTIFIFSMTSLLIVLGILHVIRSRPGMARKQAWFILAGFSVSFLLPVIFEIALPFIPRLVPQTESCTQILGFCLIAVAISRYDLFAASPEAAVDEIVQKISDAVILTDRNGKITFFNQAAMQLAACGPGQLVSENFNDLFTDPVFQDKVNGVSDTADKSLKTFSGAEVPVMISHAPITKGGKKIRGHAFVLHEITELKKVMDQLAENEKKYSMLVENSPDDIFLLNRQMEFLMVNTHAAKMMNLPVSGITGHEMSEVFPADVAVKQSRSVQEVFESGQMSEHSKTFTVTHSGKRWYSTILIPVKDEKGNVVSVMGIGRDITDVEQAELKIRENEEKYRLYLENFQGIAFRMTLDNRLEFLYGEVYNITGFTIEELFNNTPLIWRVIHPEDRMQLLKAVKMLRSIPNSRTTNECRIIHKDGKIRYLLLFLQNIVGPDGKPRYIQAAIFDKTENYELQNRVINSIMETEDRERMRFAEDLHDELGPLLSSIRMYVNLIQIRIPEAEKENRELADFTKHLLDDAVQQAKNISYNIMPEVLSQYGLIPSVKSYCSKINKAELIRIEIQTDRVGEEERFDSKIELALYRALKELINNTMKHARAGNITIRFSKSAGLPMVEYTDDGIGFDVDEKISAGATLGVRNIFHRIQSVNGSVYYTSAPGKGTKVQITWEILSRQGKLPA